MALEFDYFDVGSLTLYALIFNEAESGYRPSTKTFISYNDSSIDTFDIPMSEDGSRAGHYSAVASGLSKGIYTIEIYAQQGGTPDKSTDFLKGVGDVYWDGTRELTNLETPKFDPGSYVGSYPLDTTGYVLFQSFDRFGQPNDADTDPEFIIFENNSNNSVSGSLSSIGDGLYYSEVVVSSGNYDYLKDYSIHVTGYMHGSVIRSQRAFKINSPVSVSDLSIDVAGQLGYASGSVLVVGSNSEFTTNLSSSDNDFYNGQILRFITGDNQGQARIIRDYDGSSAEITLNKSATNSVTTNDRFIIFPIGGELNVP